MAGFDVKVKITDPVIEKKLDRLIGRMERPLGFYNNVRDHVITTTIERFDLETAPDGSKWQALSPVTLAARERRKISAIRILREYGDMFGSIKYVASSDGLRWGASAVQAALQQFGGKAGKNRSVTIRPRPFLGLSREDERAILEIAEDYAALK